MMEIFGKIRMPKALSSDTSTAANDAAEPADDNDHEHVDNDAQIQRVMHGVARDLQRAAKGCEKDAEREHAGEQPFLIDAERGDHVAVLRRGAHQHAPAGALE